MKLDRVFGGLNISSEGLGAQRRRMNAIAENLANADTTRTEQGGPYKRKIVQLKAKGAQMFSGMLRQSASSLPMTATQPGHMAGAASSLPGESSNVSTVEATDTVDPAPPRVVYDPGNPDADPNGYVTMPNVNIVTEMVNMISASRAYQTNADVMNTAKQLMLKTLTLGQ
jgi:flagellar basal-body rod protein FlgC